MQIGHLNFEVLKYTDYFLKSITCFLVFDNAISYMLFWIINYDFSII